MGFPLYLRLAQGSAGMFPGNPDQPLHFFFDFVRHSRRQAFSVVLSNEIRASR
jgi:hypothetical protein